MNGFSAIHMREVQEIAQKIDCEAIERLALALHQVRVMDGRLFILGVGGSAANASHAVNDFRKLAGIESYCPTDNISELTARTNDQGWNSFFTAWLESSRLKSKDCVFVFSVGGGDREKNISSGLCDAVDFALGKDCKVLAIVGRKNGYVAQKAHEALIVPEVNPQRITPHSEAFQSVVWHLLVSHPLLAMNRTTW